MIVKCLIGLGTCWDERGSVAIERKMFLTMDSQRSDVVYRVEYGLCYNVLVSRLLCEHVGSLKGIEVNEQPCLQGH